MSKLSTTKVCAAAKHKVEYEYRTLLGIIGSWVEKASQRVGGNEIHIETTGDIESVFINGERFNKS